MEHISTLNGFDPLAGDPSDAVFKEAFEAANRRTIENILKSYTGYFDIFSEPIQNSLDALEKRKSSSTTSFAPRLWITINIRDSSIRVVDNGCGMSLDEFKFCLKPNISFKSKREGRGHKGVGATFMAYGFTLLKLQTRRDTSKIAAILRQGRQWAEDQSGMIPRPTFEELHFQVSELDNELSGTSVEVIVGKTASERPKDLGWLGASTAEQWFDILRIKTPLGGVYLRRPPFRPKVHIRVVDQEGNVTESTSDNCEYFWPHEFPDYKVASVTDLQSALDKIAGDTSTKLARLPAEYKKLDCLYDIWDSDQILKRGSFFDNAIDVNERELVQKHSVVIYTAFLRSAKLWTSFNEEVLRIRKGQKIVHGGLQLASDFMVQGDLFVIPLTSAIGYQANAHVIVHFTDGNPDMGRKNFQPELSDLAKALAVRSVTIMRRYLDHLKPDTGNPIIAPSKALHDWRKKQEAHRDAKPLSLSFSGRRIGLVSEPLQEQDVVALFHELLGIGLVRGIKIFSTSQNETYDSLFYYDYEDSDVESLSYTRDKNPLGVMRDLIPGQTEPKVLEYKYDLDSLVTDFENDTKFESQIDWVVCWKAGSTFRERYYLNSLLVGTEGSNRTFFGSTHQAFSSGTKQPSFEVLVLDDMLRFLVDPTAEAARQKQIYSDQ